MYSHTYFYNVIIKNMKYVIYVQTLFMFKDYYLRICLR